MGEQGLWLDSTLKVFSNLNVFMMNERFSLELPDKQELS